MISQKKQCSNQIFFRRHTCKIVVRWDITRIAIRELFRTAALELSIFRTGQTAYGHGLCSLKIRLQPKNQFCCKQNFDESPCKGYSNLLLESDCLQTFQTNPKPTPFERIRNRNTTFVPLDLISAKRKAWLHCLIRPDAKGHRWKGVLSFLSIHHLWMPSLRQTVTGIKSCTNSYRKDTFF